MFKLRYETSRNFIFQVDPPFTYSDRVRNIILEDSEVPAETNLFVSGWGTLSVSQHF